LSDSETGLSTEYEGMNVEVGNECKKGNWKESTTNFGVSYKVNQDLTVGGVAKFNNAEEDNLENTKLALSYNVCSGLTTKLRYDFKQRFGIHSQFKMSPSCPITLTKSVEFDVANLKNLAWGLKIETDM
jgi:hypothetical protein